MKRTPRKPASKPTKDFPLYAHRAGHWAKKVRGKTRYFGRIAGDETGQAALARWLDEKDDLLAGREPRLKTNGPTVRDLCNRFLSHKQGQQAARELSPRTFQTYFGTCRVLVQDMPWRDRQASFPST